MKLYHVISLSTAGLLSLGTLGLLAQTKQVELNQDFRMETLTGNVAILNGVSLENIVKVDQNKYSKVTLNGEHATLEPTVYDAYHGVTSQQLENRELYRHVNHPITFENEDYLMTIQFDYLFPYSSHIPTARLAVKNKISNEVVVKNPVLEQLTSSEWINDEYLSESNGTYYYVLTTSGRNNDNSRILVYTINPDTLDFTFKFEKKLINSGISTCVDNLLYTIEYDSVSTYSNPQLMIINLETEETSIQSLGKDLYLESIIKTDSNLYFIADSTLYRYTPEEPNIMTEIPSPSFLNTLNDSNYYWISQKMVNDQYLYLLFDVYNEGMSQQFLAVLDTDKQKFVYEGKINIRQDQGLQDSYQLKLNK